MRWRGWLGALIAAFALAPPGARAETTALEGVLVLDNGNVLTGAIQREGDAYVINVTGAMLRVPVDQVERFAPTLEEAYQQRRVTLVDGTADRHLELAAWCLHLELFQHAARELLDARRIDAQNPGVETLERRLRYRMELEASRASASRDSAAPLQQARGEGAGDELQLPAISVESQAQFVRSIQPMLIRNCSTAGCHQAGADHAMQLDRWALEGRGNAATVRKNLSAVMAEVNIEILDSSELLSKARAKHGQRVANGSRPLSAHQMTLLTNWVTQAFGVGSEEVGAPAAVALPARGESLTASGVEMEIDPAVMPASFAPRDAFDPEIFNRLRTAQSADDAIDAATAGELEDSADLVPVDAPVEGVSWRSQSEAP